MSYFDTCIAYDPLSLIIKWDIFLSRTLNFIILVVLLLLSYLMWFINWSPVYYAFSTKVFLQFYLSKKKGSWYVRHRLVFKVVGRFRRFVSCHIWQLHCIGGGGSGGLKFPPPWLRAIFQILFLTIKVPPSPIFFSSRFRQIMWL